MVDRAVGVARQDGVYAPFRCISLHASNERGFSLHVHRMYDGMDTRVGLLSEDIAAIAGCAFRTQMPLCDEFMQIALRGVNRDAERRRIGLRREGTDGAACSSGQAQCSCCALVPRALGHDSWACMSQSCATLHRPPGVSWRQPLILSIHVDCLIVDHESIR